MIARDYYQVLGVPRTAERAEIRNAYVRLVKRHHPDTIGSLPHRLQDVQRAYRCLTDAQARAAHDNDIVENEHAHRVRQRLVERRLSRLDQPRVKRNSRSQKPGRALAITAKRRKQHLPRPLMLIAIGGLLFTWLEVFGLS
ncbi:J domain-containing protein [Novosphingopyxis sp. YJ-S2-01]|uniref:J domain-containing protein n=1 Tax=Novosphingopyxis sp. YJ-S2-01 TaxID=2794021 RepID=UPI0018DD38B2|nr:DnaJ domain-containing protein [Novosphingopyxis sp. YJ-S2-01]MBH9538462.1 DnaJ domain-containing protein [Novosphingopyxis sp. YJ-S2-01]